MDSEIYPGRRGKLFRGYASSTSSLSQLYKLSSDPLDKHLPHHGVLRLFRDHAVTLAQEQATRHPQELQRDIPNIHPEEAKARKSHIMQFLRRITPGCPIHLQAIRTADGSISVGPQVMANTLKDHWSGVSSARHMHETFFKTLIQEDLTPDEGSLPKSARPPHDHDSWLVTKEDIQSAIDRSPNSCPGPDGIPFLARRKLSHVAVEIPFKAYESFSSDKGASLLSEEYPSFNSSDMVFFQQFITGVDETHGGFCAPEDTRPLNITSSDNRLLANAVRFRIGPILEKWISPFQRVFLPGRFMFANIIDIDEAMTEAALHASNPADVFFDFKAAFISVLHSFLLGLLKHIGVPAPILNYVFCLYLEDHCSLIIGGARHPGFQLLSGICQGCALSLLCFAIAADLLLRRLSRLIPDACIRAYAGDLAMVLQSSQSALPLLVRIFQYSFISGLHINLPKTVLIPLGTFDLDPWHIEICRQFPVWHNIKMQHHATYFGFILGPSRGDLIYDKPLSKFAQRAKDWSAVSCGLALTTIACSVYILPVSLFAAQLDSPPASWTQAGKTAIRRLLPGPANWCTMDALRSLSVFKFPKGLPDLHHLPKAIQFRVATTEATAKGGLDVNHRAFRLRNLVNAPMFPGRAGAWADWRNKAFLFQFQSTLHHCTAKLHTKILRFWSLSQKDLIYCAWIFRNSTRVK